MTWQISCDRCGSNKTVRNFTDYNTMETELRCWPCRKTAVLERARQEGGSKKTSTPDPLELACEDTATKAVQEGGQSEQTGISDFL